MQKRKNIYALPFLHFYFLTYRAQPYIEPIGEMAWLRWAQPYIEPSLGLVVFSNGMFYLILIDPSLDPLCLIQNITDRSIMIQMIDQQCNILA